MIAMEPAVYILASKTHGTLYIGVTSNLAKRVWEHRNDFVDGFTKKYGVHRLVYYEYYSEMNEALLREKQMKKWRRGWKVNLIEEHNPHWEDLFEHL